MTTTDAAIGRLLSARTTLKSVARSRALNGACLGMSARGAFRALNGADTPVIPGILAADGRVRGSARGVRGAHSVSECASARGAFRPRALRALTPAQSRTEGHEGWADRGTAGWGAGRVE